MMQGHDRKYGGTGHDEEGCHGCDTIIIAGRHDNDDDPVHHTVATSSSHYRHGQTMITTMITTTIITMCNTMMIIIVIIILPSGSLAWLPSHSIERGSRGEEVPMGPEACWYSAEPHVVRMSCQSLHLTFPYT